jgi:hypothetical protein
MPLILGGCKDRNRHDNIPALGTKPDTSVKKVRIAAPLWQTIFLFGFDSRRFQIFWEATGLERGPLSLVRTTEELLGRNSSGSGLENQD